MTLYATAEQLAEYRQCWESNGIPAFYEWRDPMPPRGCGPPTSNAVCLHCGRWLVAVLTDLSWHRRGHMMGECTELRWADVIGRGSQAEAVSTDG